MQAQPLEGALEESLRYTYGVESEPPRTGGADYKCSRDELLRLACFHVELIETRLLFSVASPTITPPSGSATSGYENQPLILSTANGGAISVTDSGAGTSQDVVSLSVSNGTLNLATSASLIVSSGGASGSSTIVFSGTIPNINAALDGLEFSPDASFTGNPVLAISVMNPTDSLSSNANIILHIQQPPAPSVNAPGTVLGYENMASLFSGGNAISITDDQAGFNAYTETVTLLVGNGVLDFASSTGLTFTTGGASGTNDIVFSGPLLDVNNALNGMTFNPTASYHGSTPLHVTVEDNGDILTGSATVNVNIQTPTAPTIVSAAPPGGYQNTPLNMSAANGNQISVDDPVAGANFDTVSLSVSQGLLSLASSSGLTFTSGSATNSSVMVFTGSVASINGALNGMQFQPNAGYTGNAALQMSVLDQGDSLSGSSSIPLKIQTPSKPTVNTSGAVNGYANQPLIISAGYGDQISISDPEAQFGGNSDTVTMTVTNGTLDFPSTPGLTFIVGSPSGSSSVQFSGTIANINNALNGMIFQPNVGFHGATQLQIAIANPGDAQSNNANVGLNIQADPIPTISSPGTINGAENQALIISQQNGNAISVDDPSAGLNNDTVTLSVGNGTLNLARAAGITIITGAASGSSTIVFSGMISAINNALNGLAFNPTASFQGNASLAITVSNPADSLSHTGNVSLNLQQVNPTPTVTLPPPQTTATNTSIVFSNSNNNAITLSDAKMLPNPDTLTLTATNGSLTLGSTNGLTILTGGPSVWVVSGTVANLQNVMSGLTFTPTGGFNGSASLAITLTSSAGGETLSGSATLPIFVSTTIAAPIVNIPSMQTTVQNSPVVFSGSNGNQVWISDLGSTGGPLRMTLSTSHGKLSLSQVAGLAFTTGTGTADSTMTFTGSLTDINAALNGLTYTPNTGTIGSESIQISANDLGNTVVGTPQTGSRTQSVIVLNAAPTVAVPAAASPSTVTGSSTILSVLGADDGGESNLTYAWSQTNSAGAPVSFSVNGTNAAKNSVATFSQSGTYFFNVTITDAQGSSVTTSTQVTVVMGAANASGGPTVTVPGAQQTTKNVPLVFSSTGANAIEMSTSSGGAITVTLSASNGLLTLSTVSGLTLHTGAGIGDATMSFTTGSVGDITAALNGLTFTPAANFTGFGAISISAMQGSSTSYQNVPITIVAGTNQPPTVAQAAAAAPNPVTGTSTSLTVLGADDGGESNLTYSWSTLTKPPGAIGPSFSANGTNGAKNTIATFSQAGTYTLLVTITDSGGLSITSQVNVQANQTLTSIAVTPNNSSVAVLQTLQFGATAMDQFGHAMQAQPTFSWSTGTGVISLLGLLTTSLVPGNYSVSASSGGVTGVANYTTVASDTAVASPSTVTGTTTTLSVVGGLGLSYTWSVLNKPAGATNPNFSVNGSLAAQTTVATFSSAGNYVFQVAINTGVVTTQTVGVDVVQTISGITVSPASATVNENQQASFTAVAVDQFSAVMANTPNFSWVVTSGGGSIDQSGLYTAPGAGNAGPVTIAAQSGSVTGSASVTVVNAAPTVARAATAFPSPVTGISTVLNVQGADDGGESNLTYHWAVIGPAAVSFSDNNTNAAQWTTATFSKAGTYTFTATITDTEGLTTTSQTVVTVLQTLSSLSVVPGSATVNETAQRQFAATATDQFGDAISSPTVTWSITSGGGSIDSTGMYTAPASPGTATVQATSGGVSATSLVTIPNQSPTIAAAAAASPNPVTGTTTLLSVLGADDGGETNLLYTWSATGPAAVIYSDNGTNSAKDATATLSAAGTYHFTVMIMDQGGLSTTSAVTVTVNQAVSQIAVAPTTTSAERAASVTFSAVALDQFGTALQSQPVFNWSVVGTQGTITSSGVYTAPPSGSGGVTIAASSGGVSGSATVNLTDDLAASVPPAQVTQENAPVTFGNGNAITISDGDANTQTVPASVTVSVTNGTLALSELSGLTFTAGSGVGATMTFTGQLSDLDAALQGMKFTPTQGFAGQAAVNVAINETGAGGSRNYSIPITAQAAAVVTPPSSGSNGGTSSGAISIGGTSGGSGTGNSSAAAGGVTAAVVGAGAGNSAGPTAIGNILSGGTTNSPVTSSVLSTSSVSTTGETTLASEPAIILAIDAPPAPPANTVNAPPPQPLPPANAPAQAPQENRAAKPAANNAVNAAEQNGAPAAKAVAMKLAPQAPAGVPDARVVTVPSQVFSFLGSQSPMTQEIDNVKDQMVSQHAMKLAAGSATVVSLSGSAVYFIWLLRGGSLLSSMLSVLPAWKSIDPLPVLENFESRRRRKERIASDRESLESLIDRSKASGSSAQMPDSAQKAGQESV
jgi:hypothetical protein